jgi:ribonuclease T2
MMRFAATRGGWLDEISLCLDLLLRYARCNRAQGGGAAPSARLRIWRDKR